MKTKSPRLVALLLLSTTWAAAQGSYTFQAVNYPGATFTRVFGVNDHNQAVGDDLVSTRPAGHQVQGFLYSDGVLTDISVNGNRTLARDINNPGQIVGWFRDADTGINHGFLYSAGAYQTLDYPGAAETFATGINDRGDIVGFYADSNAAEHGFLLSTGVYSTFDAPTAIDTAAGDINNGGLIVGSYDTGDLDTAHGFRVKNGVITRVDLPGAINTGPSGVNDRGDTCGLFDDSATRHGFVLTASGSLTVINFPGSTATIASRINAQRVIGGNYRDADGVQHGYIAIPK